MAQARSVLQFLAESVPSADHVRSHLLNAYSKFLQKEMARIGPRADSFLLHDELEEINHPLYFHEFMAQAEAHGLQYVTEVDFRSALPNFWPPEVVQALTAEWPAMSSRWNSIWTSCAAGRSGRRCCATRA